MELKPIGDNVLLKLMDKENTLSSGIVLAEMANDNTVKAKVIAVGNGAVIDGKRSPMRISVGDNVVFENYRGTDIEVDGIDYLLVKENEILAIVD